MTELDEDQIIGILRKKLGRTGPHEDVEVFRRGSRITVVAVDTLVQSTDVPPGMKMSEVSRKAVAACVSDFAAKGVRPEFGTVSVTIPRGLPRGQLAGLAVGLQRASREFKVGILGGDTSGGAEVSVSVSLYGTAGRIVPRGGAKPGDRIFVTGYFGNTAAGLHLLLNGKKSGRPRLDARYRNAFCNPRPRLEFGTKAARYLSSSMDSSDGLAMTLNEMSRQSACRFSVTRLPYEKALCIFAERNGIPVEDLALFGGEEYEMVFTAPEKNIPKVKKAAEKSGVGLIEIGVVEPGGGVVSRLGRKTAGIPDRGWGRPGS